MPLAAVAAGGIVGSAVVVLRDPHVPGSLGYCPLTFVTGLACPGCGTLRGMHDLLTGNPLEALGHNVLLPFALAYVAWWWIAGVARLMGREVPQPPTSARFSIGLLVVIVAFVIARNLPGSPLAP